MFMVVLFMISSSGLLFIYIFKIFSSSCFIIRVSPVGFAGRGGVCSFRRGGWCRWGGGAGGGWDGLHFIYLSFYLFIYLFRYLFKRWVDGGLKIAHCKLKSVRVGEAKGLGMLSNVNKSR